MISKQQAGLQVAQDTSFAGLSLIPGAGEAEGSAKIGAKLGSRALGATALGTTVAKHVIGNGKRSSPVHQGPVLTKGGQQVAKFAKEHGGVSAFAGKMHDFVAKNTGELARTDSATLRQTNSQKAKSDLAFHKGRDVTLYGKPGDKYFAYYSGAAVEADDSGIVSTF